MRCPRCQRENYPSARFCLGCGLPLPQPPSRGKQVITALLKAFGYYALFFLVQTSVMFCYEMIVLMPEAFNLGITGEALDGSLMETLTGVLMESLAKNIHILLILSAALTLLLLFFFYQMRGKNPMAEMHFRRAPVSPLLLSLVLGIAVQFFVGITLTFLPIPESMIESFNQNRSTDLLYGGGALWLELVSITVVTPIIEEVIFRGLIFTRLRRAMAGFWAVGLCAVFFGIVHGHIIAFIYAGLLGVLLCLLMLRVNDSILAPICCHVGFNFGSYLINWSLGDTESAPLLLAVYCASIAVTLICGYLIFRRVEAEEE